MLDAPLGLCTAPCERRSEAHDVGVYLLCVLHDGDYLRRYVLLRDARDAE